jgi:periplasmic protein TonB
MQASVEERLVGALGATIGVTMLGYLLLVGLLVETQGRHEEPMTLLNIQPPPAPHPPKPHVEHPKARKTPDQGAPRNLRNKATEIVTPPPLIVPPAPLLIVAARKAGPGAAAASGAADRPGPGEGAGGRGNGTGSGDGNGEGGGDVPPRQIKGRLKFSDLPPALRDSGIGGTVAVRYAVNVDGRVSDCAITASSGSAILDQLTCQLIQQRFRFDPSRDDQGRPVRSMIEESHQWEIERISDPNDHP